MQKLVDGGYISEIPTSPSGESYSYYVTEDEESAMFSAKLNFETSGSSNKSSCDFVQSIIEYGSCSQVYGTHENTPQGQVYTEPSCSSANYDPETQQCFEVVNDDIYSSCNCASYYFTSDNIDYPSYICENISQFSNYGTCIPSIGGTPDIFVCEVDTSEAPCSGSDSKDYCSCI